MRDQGEGDLIGLGPGVAVLRQGEAFRGEPQEARVRAVEEHRFPEDAGARIQQGQGGGIRGAEDPGGQDTRRGDLLICEGIQTGIVPDGDDGIDPVQGIGPDQPVRRAGNHGSGEIDFAPGFAFRAGHEGPQSLKGGYGVIMVRDRGQGGQEFVVRGRRRDEDRPIQGVQAFIQSDGFSQEIRVGGIHPAGVPDEEETAGQFTQQHNGKQGPGKGLLPFFIYHQQPGPRQQHRRPTTDPGPQRGLVV